MAFGMFLFCTVDTQAKFLTDSFSPLQIVWMRQLGLLFGIVVLLSIRGISILRTNYFKLQLIRGTIVIISPVCFVTGIMFVPLADAIAVTFVAPFLVIVLAAMFLDEKIGVHRWIAVFFGLIGTLIIIRPGLGVFHPAVFFVFVAGSLFSVRQIISRYLSKSDKTVTTVSYTALVGSFWLSLPLTFFWKWPTSMLEIFLIINIAVLAAAAEVCVIKALEVAEATAIGPVHYTLIIWGVFYGYLVFNDIPDFWTWVGTVIIVICGLYIIHREKLSKAFK